MSLLIHTLRRLVEIGGGLLWAVGLSACAYQGHIGVAMAWSGWTTAARAWCRGWWAGCRPLP